MPTNLERQLRCLERQAYCEFGSKYQKLGEGSFGVVIKATYRRFGEKKLVAVKIAKDRSVPGYDARAALVNEAHQLFKVSPAHQPHPYIVAHIMSGNLRDPGMTNEVNALIMDFCSEGSLYDMRKRGKYPVSRLQIIYQICTGLSFIHKHGVYHRDLKPDNILMHRMSHSYVCKIGDFGLSTDQPYASDAVGTIPYMAPELTSTTVYNCAMGDVFAMGVIVYELISGRGIPWSCNETKAEFIKAKRWNERVADTFDHFLEKCLNLDPNRRPSAADLESMSWGMWKRKSE